jgi:uncharacterized protein
MMQMEEQKYKTSQYNYMIDYKDKKLFFNGVTGAGFCMTTNELETLNPLLNNLVQFQTEYSEDFERLRSLGFIIDVERDEIEYLKFKNKEEVFLKKDYQIFINPTLECNFHCWYCYETHPKGYMTEETMNKIKNHLRAKIEQDKITSLNLSWFGGEPLLYFYEVVYPLTKYAKEMCKKNDISFVSGITTNAYCMDEAMIEKIKEIDLCGFQITLDGHRERHNKIRNKSGEPSYDKIIQNINLLCRKIEKVYVTLRINYDNQTLKKQQAENILNDIDKENRKKIKIDLQRVWQTAGNQKEGEKEVSSLIDKAKSEGYRQVNYSGGLALGQFYNCYTSKYHYVEINYDGKVYKCTARDYQEPYEMGEMKEDGTIVWNESRISKLYGSATFDNPVCLKCAYLPLCWGPCPQKMVELKEKGLECGCGVNNLERSMRERLIDLYESSINAIKQNVIT